MPSSSRIALIFIGILQLIFLSFTNDDFVMVFSVAGLLTLIGLGVLFICYTGIVHDLYQNPNNFLLTEDKKPKSKLSFLYGIIMLTATIVFFIWGFMFDGFELSWLSFVVGGLSCGIVGIIDGCVSENKK